VSGNGTAATSAGGDLRIDLEDMRALARRIGTLTGDLSGSERFAQQAAGDAGDGRLAGALNDFGGNWDIHRDDLVERMEFLAASATSIADTLEDLDADLAAQIADGS